ncbi:MAG: hypothetical protein Q4C85_08630 [Actinomyces sp.]|uniref:hypothetical protein n=1 Tax=Actinomyces sp. TaxID=29317 RepID=UPI0026DBE3E3|nr:hypothetical protein [Actinomyces sp.]MDO4243803.1 hypothetical protein [Actinomyces sp.]
MAATTIEAQKKKHNKDVNIRKGLNVIVFMAPRTVDLPTAITEGAGQLTELPAGWWPVGMMTKDGFTVSTDVSIEEVEALGYLEAVRTDIVKAPRTIKFTVLEPFRKNLQELVYGVDLSALKADKTTAEVVFDEAPLPAIEELRLIAVMADGPADDEWIVGRGFPRVKLSTIPEEAWKPDEAVKFDLELSVFTDNEVGTPCRHYLGGTAAGRHLDAIGFTRAE